MIVTAVSLAALVVVACDEDLLADSTFRLWCGESLCSWKTDAGRVRQAPTWHKKDFGVELVDRGTIISQDLKSTAKQCFVFSTIADVEPSAQVWVEVDFDNDGQSDYEQPIAASGFREMKTEFRAPLRKQFTFDADAGLGIVPTTPPRLIITKRGDGRAVLAQMRLQGTDSCSGPRLRLENRPLGDLCTQGQPSECASGVCCEGLCAECCIDKSETIDVDENGSIVPAPSVACAEGKTCKQRDLVLGEQAESVPQQCL